MAASYELNTISDCKACVSSGCTWCLFSDISYNDGCYGDFYSGECFERIDCGFVHPDSESLTSNIDCEFETEVSELALAITIVIPILLVVSCVCCCYFCFRSCQPKRPIQEVPEVTATPMNETITCTTVEQLPKPNDIPTPIHESMPATTPESPYFKSVYDMEGIPVATGVEVVSKPEYSMASVSLPPAVNPYFAARQDAEMHYERTDR